jgi:hypothetical protein
MALLITLGIIALVAALPSGLVAMLIWRIKKPFAKPLAIAAAIVLFLVFCWAGFIGLIVFLEGSGLEFRI